MVAELARTPHHETAEGRRKLAAKGQTAYGTSYPVPNVAYLKKALRAVGRVAAGKRGVLGSFLRKRARQLGAWNVIKGSWADNTQGATAMANAYMRAIQLTTPDVSSSSGPRVTTGSDTVAAKIKSRLIAKGMPADRAELFARNAVKRLKKRTVSMANPDDTTDTNGNGDNDDVTCRSYLYDAQKTLSHLKRDHGLSVDEITSPIAEHQNRHEGGVDNLIKLHRAVEGQLAHDYAGAGARPKTLSKYDEPGPIGKD